MAKNPVPDDADPLFKEVLEAIRKGNNPVHAKHQRLTAKQQKAVEKAARDTAKKRKGSHRRGGGDVFDTGMFD